VARLFPCLRAAAANMQMLQQIGHGPLILNATRSTVNRKWQRRFIVWNSIVTVRRRGLTTLRFSRRAAGKNLFLFFSPSISHSRTGNSLGTGEKICS